MENSYSQNFNVDSLHVDYEKKYSLCGLMRHFHAAVEKHAYDLGVDANSILDKFKAIWIITRIRIDIDRMPVWQNDITVETFPLSPGIVRMEREAKFAFGGETFARLSSEWCMLDKDTGRPRRPGQTGYPVSMAHREGFVTAGYSKFAPDYNEADLAFTHTVRVSDLDMNVHMNNVAYIRLAGDAFGTRELTDKRLSSFEIIFKAQSFEGEDIRVYRAAAGDNKYYVSGIKTDGTRVFDTMFTFAALENSEAEI